MPTGALLEQYTNTLTTLQGKFRWRLSNGDADDAMAVRNVGIEVLLVDLADDSLNEPGELSKSERARAAAFVTASLTRRYVAGRVALRRLLAAHLGIRTSASMNLGIDSRGKLRLIRRSTEPDVRFSLARSEDMGLIAIGEGVEIGVDIERAGTLLGDAGFQAGILTPKELAAVNSMSPHRRALAVGRYWVRKEAVLKALGTGLLHPKGALAVEVSGLNPSGWLALDHPEGTQRVAWRDIPLTEDVGSAAVAYVQPEA